MSWGLRGLGLFFVFFVFSAVFISAYSNPDPCTIETKQNFVKYGNYMEDAYTVAVPDATIYYVDFGDYNIKFLNYVKKANNEGIMQLHLRTAYCYKSFNKLAFEVELAPGEVYSSGPHDEQVTLFYEGPIPGWCAVNLPSSLMQPPSQKLLFNNIFDSAFGSSFDRAAFEALFFKKAMSRNAGKPHKAIVGSNRPIKMTLPDPFALNSCFARVYTSGGPWAPNA